MGGSHSAPTGQQLGPMLSDAKAMWVRFTQAATIGVISVVILLALLALFVA